MSVLSLLAKIPSPSFNELTIGPFHLRMYGLCIAVGVIVAVWIAGNRWEARGGSKDDISAIATWAVPAGVIGARLYHVATDWKTYFGEGGHPIDSLKIWNGGLGIPGGVLAGVIVGLWVCRRRKLPGLELMDVVAPAIPVAQALGRFGNYFNQELYGRPTKLPWGLEIDQAHREGLPAKYFDATTFHPTFAYEALWNLALAGFLVWLDRKKVLRRGELFTLYVLGYALGRLWVEDLRIDKASLVLGVRINLWISGIVALVTIVVFVRNRRHPKPTEEASGTDAGGVAPSDAAEEDAVDADDQDTEPTPGEDSVPSDTDDALDDETKREALELELMDEDASEAGEQIGEPTD